MAPAAEKDEKTVSPSKSTSGAAPTIPDDPEGIIEMEVFSQIREMDEDDEDGEGGTSFSEGIVMGYFEQAEATFDKMEDALKKPDLPQLSSLGHFLKGSSAALGVIRVQNACEKIQHYGNCRDEEIGKDLTEEEALKKIEQLLNDCKKDYDVAKGWLSRLYPEA